LCVCDRFSCHAGTERINVDDPAISPCPADIKRVKARQGKKVGIEPNSPQRNSDEGKAGAGMILKWRREGRKVRK